jgi:hypothetical protein
MWRKQPETVLDKQVKTALRFDFWSSYRYSQGKPVLHQNLLRAMDIGQRLTWSETMLERREAVMDAVIKGFQTRDMPKGHSAAREPTLTPKKEYRTRWKIYERATQDEELAMTPDYRHLLRYIVFDSASADKGYLERPGGRVSRFSPEPFMSYTREFLVCGEDTHSLAFNYIFGLAHQLLEQQLEHPTEYVMRNEVLALAAKWERLHPEQEFWTPATGGNPFVVPPAIMESHEI